MMMSPKNQSNKQQSGLSLIEVLVVLVILVIGILAVVQLFPSGFGVMRGTQNASVADRLTQMALESLKQNGAPTGIYASNYDTQIPAIVFDPTQSSDNLDVVSTIAGISPSAPPAAEDVNKIRYVKDETFSLNATDKGKSPIHVLGLGPVAITDPKYDVIVNSAPWTGTVGNSAPDMSRGVDPTTGTYYPIDDPNDVLVAGAPTYMVDYTNGQIAVAPEPYNQTFAFSVTISGVTYARQLTVHAQSGATTGYQGGWFPIVSSSGVVDVVPTSPAVPSTGWDSGSLVLYRPFNYLTTFDSDPYEFNLNETNNPTLPSTAPPGTTKFNTGVLAFNPALANSNTTQSLKIEASYTVYDWHVIHEDHEIPTSTASGSSTISFRLAINDVKEVGDVQSDGTTSTGVVLSDTDPAPQLYDFVFLNLDNGAMATASNHSQIVDDDQGGTGPGTIHVSFRNGRLIIPTPLLDSTSTPIQHLRVFYRGTADWAIAVQRAPARYVSVASLGLPPTATAPYFAAEDSLVPGSADAITVTPQTPNLYFYTDTDSSPGKGDAHTIYLPFCDLGKQITLTNVVVTVASGANHLSMTIPSLTLTALVATSVTTQKYISENIATSEQPIKDAKTALENQLGATVGSGTLSLSIGGVTGVSARAIVIWRERNVWKRHTLDTILPDA